MAVTAASTAPIPAAASGGIAGVSTDDEETWTSTQPPWWQFHRRLSLPIMAGIVDPQDNNKGTTELFDTIDWGDKDDDGDDSLLDKQPRESKLIIDFNPRRNSSSNRINSINDIDDEDKNDKNEVEASDSAIEHNNDMNIDSGHENEPTLKTQSPSNEESSQEEMQKCEQASKKSNHIYVANNINGGGDSSSNNTDKMKSVAKAVSPTSAISTPLPPPTPQMDYGLDESDDNDDRLINYSFDECDGKDGEQQGSSKEKCTDTHPTIARGELIRPPFHPSKSMEIHDSIWNLSSSELEYDPVAKENHDTEPEIVAFVPTATTTVTAMDGNVLDNTDSLVSKVDNLDDVSSIASSIHSGRVFQKNKMVPRRSLFVKSPSLFGLVVGQRNNLYPPSLTEGGVDAENGLSERIHHDGIDTEDDGIDDVHSQGGSSSISIRSWCKKQQPKPIRRQSFAASLKLTITRSSIQKTKGQSTSDELYDENDDLYSHDNDEDDRYFEEEFFAAKDATNNATVKDACEIMNTVNKSAIAMGMEPPFLPVAETFPPIKKLHTILGYQMMSLKSSIGNPSMTKRKSHRMSKSGKKHVVSPSVCSDPSVMDDRRRLSAYIQNQMSKMEPFSQSSHELLEPSSASACTCNPYIVHAYTSYLPNFMWYQPVASDATTNMRPTSLCSGTGITGKSQYLQPDMLNVFRMFGSYLVGSGHLFREDEDEDNKKNNNKNIFIRRSAFWPDIPENEDENGDYDDESVEGSNESVGSNSTSSSIDYDYRDSRLMQQNEFIEQIIEDLRSSQIVMMKKE